MTTAPHETPQLFGPTLSERIAERTQTLGQEALLGLDETPQPNGLTCLRRAVFDADFIGATLFDCCLHDTSESAYVLVSWASGKLIGYYSKEHYTIPEVIVTAARSFNIWLLSGMATEDYDYAQNKQKEQDNA